MPASRFDASGSGAPQAADAASPVPPVVQTIIEVLRASASITTALAPITRRFGLSLAAFNVLHTLAHAAGPLPPTSISREQVIPPQTLTSVLESLEKRGLIERVQHPGDRRMLLALLTPEGASLYHACCQPLAVVEFALLSALSELDMDTLRGLLERIGAPGEAPP